jgi:hypothetical protein
MLSESAQGEATIPKGFVVEAGPIELRHCFAGKHFALPSASAPTESSVNNA